jgi:hypothetical protein
MERVGTCLEIANQYLFEDHTTEGKGNSNGARRQGKAEWRINVSSLMSAIHCFLYVSFGHQHQQREAQPTSQAPSTWPHQTIHPSRRQSRP